MVYSTLYIKIIKNTSIGYGFISTSKFRSSLVLGTVYKVKESRVNAYGYLIMNKASFVLALGPSEFIVLTLSEYLEQVLEL